MSRSVASYMVSYSRVPTADSLTTHYLLSACSNCRIRSRRSAAGGAAAGGAAAAAAGWEDAEVYVGSERWGRGLDLRLGYVFILSPPASTASYVAVHVQGRGRGRGPLRPAEARHSPPKPTVAHRAFGFGQSGAGRLRPRLRLHPSHHSPPWPAEGLVSARVVPSMLAPVQGLGAA